MRINARANPPTAPQFQLPGQQPTPCLNISTYEKSKLEELEEDVMYKNVRIGVMVKKFGKPQLEGEEKKERKKIPANENIQEEAIVDGSDTTILENAINAEATNALSVN